LIKLRPKEKIQMHKTTFTVIAAGALIGIYAYICILAGVAGWATLSNRPLQAKASTANETQINLPDEEFQDFSLVFPTPIAERRSPPSP
jgi:hypothetical protein